jgi:hypothetical protein
MRLYGSRGGAIPAAAVPLSPSLNRSLEKSCEPAALLGVMGVRRLDSGRADK